MNPLEKKIRYFFICVLVSISSICYAQQKEMMLSLDLAKVNDVAASHHKGEYLIETKGLNPYIISEALKTNRSEQDVVLSFEYFCPKGLDFFKIHFGENSNSKTIENLNIAEGWVVFSVDLTNDLKTWGKIGDHLKFDFGSKPNVGIRLRNISLRKITKREKQIAATVSEKQQTEATMESNLSNYLSAKYPGTVTSVIVGNKEITVRGKIPNVNNVFLVEVKPHQDITEMKSFKDLIPLKHKIFNVKIPRITKKEGFNYDRLLSKWALVKKTENGFQLYAHAHYPDSIIAKNNLTKLVAKGKKGLGGFSLNRGHLSDLDDLDITSATVNISFSRFMYSKPDTGRIAHVYNGNTYYFDKKAVAEFDTTFKVTAAKGIVTAGILLIDKLETSVDPVIGKLLQHPDMDPAGIYSMPNMTTSAAVDCYAAALDFFSSRYNRSDNKYGRCDHWIMHNEVDLGWVWTNMGNKSALVFMDAYLKSMRICYAIARQYNPYSEVFISLTHFWTLKASPQFYSSKELMEILLKYTEHEGDFKWAMAQHPYPEDLGEPKTWKDHSVDFTFSTPLITFKNIEVLDAWIKKPEVLYRGRIKRTLWLSENGTNSRTYSEQDLFEQAAGFAYAWKKISKLDGIDGFQWHNWIDNRGEGGLRIGLRRFPDDENDPGGKKPVWEVYKAADTNYENTIFDQYKELIGIKNWTEVNHTAPILP